MIYILDCLRCLFVVLILKWTLLIGCDMTCFCYITETTIIIYSFHEHHFGSPWLWDVNRGNSYISLAMF